MFHKNVLFQLTLIPADLHFATASGTAALGGSIIDIRPTKVNIVWFFGSSPKKLIFSVSNWSFWPNGNLSSSIHMCPKPRTRSPRPPKYSYALSYFSLHASFISVSSPLIIILPHRARIRSGAPFMTNKYLLLTSWMDNCHLLVELNGISATFGLAWRIDPTTSFGLDPVNIISQHFKRADSDASPAVSRFKIGPVSPARNTARLQSDAIRPSECHVGSSRNTF